MFSTQQKRNISDAIQKVLKGTNHPELPKGEIQFALHVDGAQAWSWADIKNNNAVTNPEANANPFNERDLKAPQDDYASECIVTCKKCGKRWWKAAYSIKCPYCGAKKCPDDK